MNMASVVSLDGRDSIISTFAFSLLFHGLVLFGVPIMLKLMAKPVKYERPHTFQLVSVPASQPLRTKTAQAVGRRKAIEPKPATDRKSTSSRSESQPAEEENVEELSELLNRVSPPMQVTGMSGDFKYHWYLRAVEQKARQYWNPPTGNPNDSVVVSFTIFADGTISEVSIVQSSGKSLLDNMAVRTFQQAAPFGKLPPGFSDNRLELIWTLRTERR